MSEIENREVAVTGKLASMSRAEAIERIHAAGGRYVERPTADTALLAVGQGGPPLEADGRPTQALRAARELQASGASIEILSEQEFLGRLGLGERGEDVHRLYTTAQLARILGVPTVRLRSWVRSGLIVPVRTVHRLALFDFHQVAVARTLAELTRDGVGVARIQRSLEELAGWLGEASADVLDGLDTAGTLLVRLEDGRLAEPSGQLRLGFDDPRETPVLSVADARPADHGEDAEPPGGPFGDPDDLVLHSVWFERAVRAEERGDPEAAVRAYRRAIGEDGPTPEACFNLGNVLYGLERRTEAADAFAQATEVDPDHVEAWNNLGNVLVELERHDDAVRAFRRALAVEPSYADAHFNLATTLMALGDRAGARRHYLAYLREDPTSPWAAEVHDRLSRLD